MKITIFSSNQPRHLHLAKKLASISDTVYLVSEVNTIFPGQVADFYKKSETMQTYFEQVIKAEKKIFGDVDFLPQNIRTLSIKSGDLNRLSSQQLGTSLDSDIFIVFGASYIKGWLIDFLVEKQAVNIHMGISPYYRGSSCNFWALNDGNFDHVGSTIHMLSKGLDSGDMLFHCLPKLQESDSSFDFTMRSVKAAHFGLFDAIKNKSILEMERVKQDKSKELRYTRNSDFTDEVAKNFLENGQDPHAAQFNYPELLNPYFI